MKKRTEINPECAKRLKELLLDRKITQTELHKMTGISLNTISKIINRKSPLTPYIASEIANCFPGIKYEWLLGNSDYKTDTDVFNAVFDKHNERYEKKVMALTLLAGLRGIEILLISSGFVIGPSGGYEDIYVVRCGEKQFHASYSEITEWVDDILDFTELKLNRLVNKMGGSDNG